MSDERPDALLKSALEKIVYFEARADQLHRELEATRQDVDRFKRELADTQQREIVVRRELAELEVRVNRAHAERDELARLNQALRDERTQLMGKLLDASRIHTSDHARDDVDDEFGIDLASFISQLRSEALNRPASESMPVLEARPARVAPAPAAATKNAAWSAPPVPDKDEPLFSVGMPGFVPALAVAPKVAQASVVSPVVQQAQRLHQEGRLGVSAQQLAELSGHSGAVGGSDETLFGFSVRELSSPDPASRVRAAERLKNLAMPAAAPALATALHAETEPAVQVSLLTAFAGLCREEGASVVSPLLASPVAEVRITALKALLTLAPDEAAPHLAQAMKDPDRAVRRRASLLALGLEGEAARKLGEDAIRDTDAEVRALAALALGAANGEGARTLLLESLLDPEFRVRKAAAQSLSRILGHDVSSVVGLDEPQRRREVRRLATLPAHPVRAVLEVRPAPRAVPVEAVSEAPAVVRAAAPVAAPEPRVPAPRLGPSPVETLCTSLMADIRSAIRGRSMGELTAALSAPVEVAQEAITLLLARGAVIRRGHKYFAA